MSFQFEALGIDHAALIAEFNTALDGAGADPAFRIVTQVGRSVRSDYPATKQWYGLRERSQIVAAALVQLQAFQVGPKEVQVANIQSPVSLALAEKRYAHTAAALVRTIEERWPFCFAAGMGDADRPFPRILRALRWHVTQVPFFFSVRRAFAFLRNIRILRATPAQRLALDCAAITGLPSVVVSLLRAMEPRLDRSAVLSDHFDTGLTSLWLNYRQRLSMAAERSAEAVDWLYPRDDPRLKRCVVVERGNLLGWAVLQFSDLRDSPYFGNMRVGTILDAVAAEGRERDVLTGALVTADRLAVDLVVANQMHAAWRTTFTRLGFFQATSNYLLALAPDLARAVTAADPDLSRTHFTRGDADGRVNL